MDSKNIDNATSVAPFMAADPIYFCQFDGKSHAIEIKESSEIYATANHPCWIHLDYTKKTTIDWINASNLLPDLAKNALLEPNQISKEIRFDNAILVTLKGINVTSDNYPDPIITFRFYIIDNLIISTRSKKIDATALLKKNLDKGMGPVDVADWLIQLSDLLTDQASESFDKIHNKIVKLEDNVLNQHTFSHKEIARVRKQLIVLRRLLVGERDIFVKIATERVSWMDDNDRRHLHDISTRLSHCVSDIDASLLRLGALMEQINTLLTESMNKRIYLMSLFTLVFMPITFLTSLLGVNLTGIPFNDNVWGFGIFSGLLVIISLFFLIWLKLKKWY